eukprot:CAMPEP_0185787278 /NCGR_PEP_ID=MMETSP1174-20130828/139731_1 /TAXON_ID=35687 /ORGANISM="Dictyocha speculum, Strain CCMP1381" /LENGTH=53 /DNA_ID=CAMNT_0028480333 /DNA_START=193 /DNA_END=354 /DNA_ORIENTATION=-
MVPTLLLFNWVARAFKKPVHPLASLGDSRGGGHSELILSDDEDSTLNGGDDCL